MRGRDARERQSWLLMKHRDEEVRPAAEYDITEDRPESVSVLGWPGNSQRGTVRSPVWIRMDSIVSGPPPCPTGAEE